MYLIKISSEDYNNFLNNKIKINDDFLFSIFNKCEYFNNKSVISIPYVILLTDSYRACSVMFNMDGNIIKYSSLLLDEEEDILEVSDKLATIKLDYEVKGNRRNDDFLTRKEICLLRYIKKDLTYCYQKKNIDKLKYLYYEYFNKECDDIDQIYNDLMKELSQEVNEKHYNLYNLIKLSLVHKNA